MLKINKLFLVFLFLAFFVLPSQKANAEWWEGRGYTIIETDTIWRKTDNLFFTKKVVVVKGAKLTIEKGAIVRFGKEDIFVSSLDVIDGTIIAEGTQEEKIIFTANEEENGVYNIKFTTNADREASFFRYVEISNGGYLPQMVKNNKKILFINTALAEEGGVPAFQYSSGKIHMENCEFKNNIYGDISANGFFSFENLDYLEVVNSNFNGDASHSAINSSIYCYNEETEEECPDEFILKNNWYGDPNGPSGEVENDETNGARVIGSVVLDSWRKNDMIADPVIIIPGIMGSQEFFGEWKLDPVMRIYKNLISSLEKNGFEKGKNLFEFPYQWRNENSITAQDLHDKIQEIKNNTKISKVDLVAHSMGGLVARQYIEKLDQEENIDQLITLGTPHKGAPGSYLTWEAGEGFEDVIDKIIKKIFQVEAKHAGYDDLGKYIREKVLSVGELLPDYDYLYDVAIGEMKNYSNGYPKNEFLESLNDGDNLDKLDKVNFTNIIGDTNSDETMKKFRVVSSTVSGSWEHGMPENFNDLSSDQGIEYGQGDETVPLESAEGISVGETIKIDSAHNDLPTKAQCYAIEELTGKDDCDYVDTFSRIKSILTFGIFSPIDIQVIAPSGLKAGKNFATGEIYNEIDGAYYSGFDTENEFLTIANPENGEYKVIIEGTDNGEYKIEMAKISEDENGAVSEITGEINGTATEGTQEEKIVEVSEGKIDTGEGNNQDSMPPAIIISSPQNKNYPGDSNLEIIFLVSDNISQSEKIQTEIYLDNEKISLGYLDLSKLIPGKHKFKISAIDEANNKSEKEVEFSVDMNLNIFQNNVEKYYRAGLIKNKAEKNKLLAETNLIQNELKLLQMIKLNPFLNKKMKNLLITFIERDIDQQFDFMIKGISQDKNSYDLTIKKVIIADLNWIKNNL